MISPAHLHAAVASSSLEWMLTDPLAFRLTTATPLQRAVCRIINGRPLLSLATHPDVIEAIGGEAALRELPSERHMRPSRVVLLGGVRSAKSLIAAATAVLATQQCDIADLRPGEIPRVSILSIDKDKADVVLNDHLIASTDASPMLGVLRAGKPVGDSVKFRHPSGRLVEIMVVAGKRAGGSLVSRWSAGVIFDEAARMVGADDGVVNLEDARKAVASRLRKGAQMIEPTSPWAADGPVYNDYVKYFGHPTQDVVVIKCRGPAMNPTWWNPAKVEEIRRSDPDSYTTDVEANFLSGAEALLSRVAIEESTRKGAAVLPYDPALSYTAAMDPATRGNAWTLTIMTREGRKRRVVGAWQWVGSSATPLRPRDTLREIADIVHGYSISSVGTDQYSADALRDLASPFGIHLVERSFTEHEMGTLGMRVRETLLARELELSPDGVFLADMRRVRRVPTARGFRIDLPKTDDGRHCDYWPSFARCMSRYLEDEKPRVEDIEEQRQKKLREAAERRFGRRKDW